LAAARCDPTKRLAPLPPACRPQDATDAYKIQNTLHGLLKPRFGSRIGYKIGCTTPIMQEYLGIDQPCAGIVRAGTLVQHGDQSAIADLHAPGVECEIAVRLGRDLAAREAPYGQNEVAGAVESIMAGIEIVDNRYVDLFGMGGWSLTADDFVNAGAVLGPPVAPNRLGELGGIKGALEIDGKQVGHGHGWDVLGHPMAALAWLANTLPNQGRMLKAGDLVLLGSVVQTAWLAGPCRVTVRFEELGEASATFV
jgi:2-oxo-3-hexenedioate decarboxylase/2-keto-4-pentenoate hydratase